MDLATLLPLLIPIFILQIVLIFVALRDLLSDERKVVGGNKLVWALIIVFVNLIGPILYFLVGRTDE
jgi:hypothetical protein